MTFVGVLSSAVPPGPTLRSLRWQTPQPIDESDEVTDEVAASADSLWESFLAALPRLGVALALIVIGIVLGRILRTGLHRILARRNTPSFATVMSKVLSWIFVGLVVLAALAVTFPSVKPVDLLAGLGFFSVAVGFAFQDILENTLSGVLLLFRQPFQSGDQIAVDGNVGTVEAITIRETRIRQFDGQLLVVPNRDVYKNAIRVQTDAAKRRIDVVVGVAYEEDLDEAKAVIERVLAASDVIDHDHPVDAFVIRLGVSTIDFQVRFWVDAFQYEALRATDEVIRAVKRELDVEGIEMPSDIMALQATPSLRAALHDRPVTPGGAPAGADRDDITLGGAPT